MSRDLGAADALVASVAAALRQRVGELARAEAQRASFVFREGVAGRTPAAAEEPAWVVHLARAVHAATEPSALDLLRSLRGEPRTTGEIALSVRPGGDRLAAGAWIGDLAAAGLVGRDLETDAVALAPLGEAILDLLEAAGRLAGEAAAAEPSPDRPSRVGVP